MGWETAMMRGRRIRCGDSRVQGGGVRKVEKWQRRGESDLGFNISLLFIASAASGAHNNPNLFCQKFRGTLLMQTLTVETRPYLDKTKRDLGLIPRVLAKIIRVKKGKRVEIWSNS
jgi:hypothetical protein